MSHVTEAQYQSATEVSGTGWHCSGKGRATSGSWQESGSWAKTRSMNPEKMATATSLAFRLCLLVPGSMVASTPPHAHPGHSMTYRALGLGLLAPGTPGLAPKQPSAWKSSCESHQESRFLFVAILLCYWLLLFLEAMMGGRGRGPQSSKGAWAPD